MTITDSLIRLWGSHLVVDFYIVFIPSKINFSLATQRLEELCVRRAKTFCEVAQITKQTL